MGLLFVIKIQDFSTNTCEINISLRKVIDVFMSQKTTTIIVKCYFKTIRDGDIEKNIMMARPKSIAHCNCQ